MKNFIIAIALTLIALTTGCATTGIQVQQEVQYSHKCENPRYMHTLTCRAHQMRVRMAQMKKESTVKVRLEALMEVLLARPVHQLFSRLV